MSYGRKKTNWFYTIAVIVGAVAVGVYKNVEIKKFWDEKVASLWAPKA